MARIMLQLPAVAQEWRTGTQRHSPAPVYHGLTRSCSLSLDSNGHLNSAAPVCVRQGFDVGHVGCDTVGHSEWLSLSLIPRCREKNHILITTDCPWLCVKAFPPVTGPVRRVEGCVKYQSERAAGWTAAQRDRGSGPAVDLISPMGLPVGKACLIWYTCATSCLSCCLAL